MRRMFPYTTDGHLVLPVKWTATTVVLVIGLIMFTFGLLVIMGICVWPYLFSAMVSETPLANFAVRLLISGGVALAASLVLGLVLGWCDSDYSVVKSLACTYLLALGVCGIMMAVLHVDLLGSAEMEIHAVFLPFMVHCLVAMLLSMVPCMIATGCGFLLRVIGIAMYTKR